MPATNQAPVGGDKSVKPMEPKAAPMGSAPKQPNPVTPAGQPTKSGDAKSVPMGGEPKGSNSGTAPGKPAKPGDVKPPTAGSPPKKL
jgi:hypothetical protein